MERVRRLFTSTAKMNYLILMRFKSWYISTDVIGSIHQLISKPTIQQQLKQNLILQTTYQKKMNSNTILILNVTVILGLAYLLASATPIPRAPRQASTSTPIPTDAPTCQDAAPKNCSAEEANIKLMCDAVFYRDLISSSCAYEAMSEYLDTLLVLIMEEHFQKFDCLCGKDLDGFRQECLDRFYPTSCN